MHKVAVIPLSGQLIPLVFISLFSMCPTSASADEASAIAEFESLNNTDVQMARIAVTQANTDAVRSLGAMIIEDHEPIGRELREIADRLGVAVKPASANSDYVKLTEALKNSAGPLFDKTYLGHELAYSRTFIGKLKDGIIPVVKHEEIATYLKGLVPKFEMHLAHIEHTAALLEADVSSVEAHKPTKHVE